MGQRRSYPIRGASFQDVTLGAHILGDFYLPTASHSELAVGRFSFLPSLLLSACNSVMDTKQMPWSFYTVGKIFVNGRVDLHKVFTLSPELSRILHTSPLAEALFRLHRIFTRQGAG